MANIEELVIELSANTKDLQAEMKAAVSSVKDASDKMAKSLEESSKTGAESAGILQTAIGTMAGFISGQAVIGAFNTVKDAVLGFAESLVVEGVSAAIETQSAMNQLTNALARQGNLLPDVAKDMAKMAEELERTTKFTDDAALSAAALLENITQLDSEGLQKATKAAADLSSAMGIDLQSAATLVGKAINGNTAGLQRYGIEVQKGSNDTETFANVITGLNKKFGGSAASEIQPYQGAIGLMGKAWEDVTKVIGGAIINNKTVLAAIQGVSDVLRDFGDFLGENSGALQTFFGQLVTGSLKAAQVVIAAFETIQVSVQAVIASFEAIGIGIGGVAAAAVQAAQGNFSSAADTMKSAFEDVKTTISGINDTPALEKLSDAVGKVGARASLAFEETAAGATATVEPINNAAAAMNKLTAEQKLALDQATEFATKLVESVDTVAERDAIYLEQITAQREAQVISDQEFFATKEQLIANNIANEQAQLDAALAAKRISQDAYNQAQLALTLKSNADQMKFAADRQKFEEEVNKKRAANFASTLNTISSLASANNSVLAGIGKAAAITQATIDGYAAVQKALASAPPPFNFALAAVVGAATAANVAKIAGVPLASGIDEVPGTGNQDNFPAVLMPGERVVPTETNQDLKAFLANQGNGNRPTIQVTVQMSGVITSEPRELGQRLIDVINEAAQANGVTLLGSTV